MRTGTLFCQAIYKGIEVSEWEELYFHYREMSKATGAKMQSESQKAKALWAMKAAWDRGEECYDPARKEDILGRTKNSPAIMGRTSQRHVDGTREGTGMFGESPLGLAFCFTVASLCSRNGFQHRWCKDFAK